MDQERLHNTIEKYLDGELSSEEILVLEKMSNKNSEIAQAIQDHRKARQATELLVEKELRGKLKKWKKEKPPVIIPQEKPKLEIVHTKKEEPPRRHIRRIMSMAASFLILIIPSYFISQNQIGKVTNEAIASTFYKTPSNLAQLTKAVDPPLGDDPVTQAFLYFDNKDFDSVIKLLEPISSKTNKAQFALGLSYFEKSEYEKAITNFKNIKGNDQGVSQEDADWYLLLSYLRNNQTGESFENLLEKITTGNEKNDHYQKAWKIKNKMDSFWRRFV